MSGVIHPYIGDAPVSSGNPVPVNVVAGGGGGGAVTAADAALVTIGALADAAAQDASGTVNAHLRGVVVDLLALLVSLGATADASAQDATGSVNAHLRGAVVDLLAILATLGATTDAAVVTDANGTINAHVRGILVEAIALLAKFPSALGQATMANSLAVTLASNQSALSVTPSGTVTVDSELPAAAALADATANPTVPAVAAHNMGYNGTTWDRLRTGGTGMLLVTPAHTTGAALVLLDNIDAIGNVGVGAHVLARPTTFNGTNWDRLRGVLEATLLASAARTITQTSADLVNYNGKSLAVVLDMTAVGTGSVTVTIDVKDGASGKYLNLLTGAAITTNVTMRYRVSPRLAAVANSVAQDELGRLFRIVVTANNANAATYSVGYIIGL